MKFKFSFRKQEHNESIFQIIILIVSTFAFAFIIAQNIPIVSAEGEITWNCCSKTKAGAICQDTSSSTCSEECAETCIPSKCDKVAECKSGCCIDDKEGLCTTKSTQKKCVDEGGIWKNNENCLVPECQKGCCVLGGDVEFATEKRCGLLANIHGFEKDFRDLGTEIECLALKETQEWGACINGGSCVFNSEIDCANIGGKFSKNKLCSNPGLNAGCEKQKSVGCIEGKDEIYWFDSCGNRENIYSSDKDKSWNNGEVLKKQDACNSDDANINSETCGNCNNFLGSKCSASELGGKKAKDGNFICKSLNCVDEQGDKRNNGESWCVYDGFIGDGKDVVGSRHWRNYCIDGEVKTEPCADYRGEICAEEKMENDKGDKFSIASCVLNEAMACISYNGDFNMMQRKCNQNKQCMIKDVNIDKGFKFKFCVGEYPRGMDLSSEREGMQMSDNLCEMATQNCTVIYEKKISGWKCVINCDCEDAEFVEKMNDLCVSLGDCGNYVNYVGKGTDNIELAKNNNKDKFSWITYAQYALPVKGQFAKYGAISKELLASLSDGRLDEASINPAYLPDQAAMNMINMAGGVAGGMGLVTAGLMKMGVGAITEVVGTMTVPFGEMGTLTTPLIEVTGNTLLPFAKFLGAIGIGMLVATLVNMAFGFQGDAALIVMVTGAVTGAVLYIWGFDPITLAIAILIVVLLKVFGIGETKKKIVQFRCLPWQPPIGGDDCEKCNDDKLKPCSEYRCNSLGTACKLLNENEEYPICVASKNDLKSPVISPGNIQDGFKFENEKLDSVDIRTANGECIPEFTPVLFSLNTDEYAQCKLSFERTDYEKMTSNFAEKNLFMKNHTAVFIMPSLDSLMMYNISGNVKDKFGDIDMYVRCIDDYENGKLNEYVVNFCASKGKDITPVKITSSNPANGAGVEFGTTEKQATFYLSEPAECKWDSKDKEYEELATAMDCNTETLDYLPQGWTCSANLTNIKLGENKYYIRCKDQPWFAETNESLRNIHQESYIYTLKSSNSRLKINSVSPNGEISFGFEPISVDLEVQTAGGIDNGNSVCYYDFSGYDNMIQFYDTFSNKHKQTFNMMMRGSKYIYIKCEDEAKNMDYANATFNLNIDTSPPKIVRVYSSGSQLKVITDEEAECAYSLKKCNFNMENATSMTIGLSKEHYIDWTTGQTYYIKCEDVFGNENPGCAMKIMYSPLV